MFIKTHHFNDNELNLRDLTVALNTMVSCYLCHKNEKPEKTKCAQCFKESIKRINKAGGSYKSITELKLIQKGDKYFKVSGIECEDKHLIAIAECLGNIKRV